MADVQLSAQGAIIKTAYEAQTGAWNSTLKTKLDGIEASADVTDTANVTAAGALMDSEVNANLKTFVLPASTTISTYGRTLVDDADAATARTTLGLVIGTNVQAQDAGLQSIAGLTTLADRMIYTTASDTYAVATLTSFARTILDDTDAATARTTLSAAARSQTDYLAVLIAAAENKDYVVTQKMPFAGTITDTTTRCASGTCTATFKINTTALGGSANSVSSTESSVARSTSNTFSAGDDIVITISANSSAVDVAATITFTRTLA
jgi:hypothetical protein